MRLSPRILPLVLQPPKTCERSIASQSLRSGLFATPAALASLVRGWKRDKRSLCTRSSQPYYNAYNHVQIGLRRDFQLTVARSTEHPTPKTEPREKAGSKDPFILPPSPITHNSKMARLAQTRPLACLHHQVTSKRLRFSAPNMVTKGYRGSHDMLPN